MSELHPPGDTTSHPLGDGLLLHPDGLVRCWWCGEDPLYVAYHDHEWGVAVHDERRLFEKLCLEGFQAGLSWLTILRKREAFRESFADFDPDVVARFDDRDVERLLGEAGIVRHRAKIEAVVSNARALLALHENQGSLDELVWSHRPDEVTVVRQIADVPATTPASHALAARLRRLGFRYVGPTTAYALLQATGVVDDHLLGCAFRRAAAPGRRATRG